MKPSSLGRTPRSQAEFDKLWDYEITPAPKNDLKLFLAGKSDSEIANEQRDANAARASKRDASAVRANIGDCAKFFYLSDNRPDLVELFNRFNPDLVSNEVLEKYGLLRMLDHPGGVMPLDSNFYVARATFEIDCLRTLKARYGLLRVKAPQGMGKTSLLIRLQKKLEQEYQTAVIDFKETSTEIFKSQKLFFSWFCNEVIRELQLTEELRGAWEKCHEDNRGEPGNCTEFFTSYLFPVLKKPFVLCLDNVDETFKYEFLAPDFLGMLRAWHERSKKKTTWGEFRMFLLYSTDMYIKLSTHQSPFNVGTSKPLPQFETQQIIEMAKPHGLALMSEEVERIKQMTGGHPFLVHTALYTIATKKMTLDELLVLAFNTSNPYFNHLRRIWGAVSEDKNLLTAIEEVITNQNPVKLESDVEFKLTGLGVVKPQGKGVVTSCALYRNFFAVEVQRELFEAE
jgi:hypothetical protein